MSMVLGAQRDSYLLPSEKRKKMGFFSGLPYDIILECLVKVPFQDLPIVASVCRRWRQLVFSHDFIRRRKVSGSRQKIILIDQIFSNMTHENLDYGVCYYFPPPSSVGKIVVWEPASGFWGSIPAIPNYHGGFPIEDNRMAIVGFDLVLFGGANELKEEKATMVFIFNFLTRRWRHGRPMPGPRRVDFACTSDGEKMVLVAGGRKAKSSRPLKSSLIYNVIKDSWIALPDMLTERDLGVAAFEEEESVGGGEGGKFTVLSPIKNKRKILWSMESFDLSKWQWSWREILHPCDNVYRYIYTPYRFTPGLDGRLFAMMVRSKIWVLDRGSSAWKFAGQSDHCWSIDNRVQLLGSWQDAIFTTCYPKKLQVYVTRMRESDESSPRLVSRNAIVPEDVPLYNIFRGAFHGAMSFEL